MRARFMLVASIIGFGLEAGNLRELSAGSQLVELGFLAGAWKSQLNGELVEEHWTMPAGDAIIGMYRWMDKSGKTRLVEIQSIKLEADGPTLRLRHFDGALVPWKSESGAIAALVLKDRGKNRARFVNEGKEGGLKHIDYERAADTLTIVVTFRDEKREPLRFELTRITESRDSGANQARGTSP